MNLSQKPIIPLYKERTFTQKFNDTFDYFGRNWKVYLRMLTYILLPLSMFQALSLNTYIQGMMDIDKINNMSGSDGLLMQFIAGSAATMVFSIIGMTLVFGMTYALMMAYEENKGDISGMTFKELLPKLKRTMLRAATAMVTIDLIAALILLVSIGIAMVSPFLLVLPLFGSFALFIPLSLLFPVYIFERISITEALKKTIVWGFKTWGGIFAICFVISLIVSMVGNMASIPYSILLVMKSMVGITSDLSPIVNSPVYTIATYIMGVLTTFVSYLGYSILAVAIAYQYGHAADKLDDEGITSQINDFDNLANDGRNNSGNNDDTGKNDDTRNNAGNYGYGNGSGYDSNNNQGNTNGKPRFDEIDDFEKL